MIVVRLLGGLGNQLFQYALGRRLSLERGEPLKFDPFGFASDPLRQLSLDHFVFEPEFATPTEIHELTDAPQRFLERFVERERLPRFLRRSRLVNPNHVKEREGFRFGPTVLRAPSPLYLDGYWQSERYFDTIPAVICEDLTLREPAHGRNAELAERIHSCEAVSLHVRRSDYVTDSKIHSVHGVLGLDYYAAAVSHMQAQLDAPCFFVFSDDPAWAAAHLELPGDPVFVDHNGAQADYEDLRLMSLCGHHVIANSSFSWWGAWLSRAPGKHVVAPRRWLADPARVCPDVCPPTWVRL